MTSKFEIIFRENETTIKELIITNKKAPYLVVTILGFFSIISFLFPVIITIVNISEGNGLHFGIILLIIMCWFPAWWLLKMLLWNRVGKEHFKFSKSTIIYIPNYKWFKGKPTTLKKDNLKVGKMNCYNFQNNEGNIHLWNGKESIESVIKVPIKDLNEIITKLKKDLEAI